MVVKKRDSSKGVLLKKISSELDYVEVSSKGNKVKVPLKVEVISIAGIIFSVILAILGVLMVIDAGDPGLKTGNLWVLSLFFGILVILISVSIFFLSFNLRKLKNWARGIMIGISVLIIFGLIPDFSIKEGISDILFIIFSSILILVLGYVIWCLGFDEEVKKAF